MILIVTSCIHNIVLQIGDLCETHSGTFGKKKNVIHNGFCRQEPEIGSVRLWRLTLCSHVFLCFFSKVLFLPTGQQQTPSLTCLVQQSFPRVFQHFLFAPLEQHLWQNRLEMMSVLDTPLNAETSRIDETESRNKEKIPRFQPVERMM